MRRRALLVAAGSGTVTLSAGCLGVLTGREALAFEATKATVPGEAQAATGYEEATVRTQTLTREYAAAGQSREVEVTNWVARYERTIALDPIGEQELGLFVGFSTPQVEVLGQTFNPVGDMSNRELLDRLQSRFEGLTVGDRVGTAEVRVLGQPVTVEKFEATATVQGAAIDLYVHVATVAHGSDFVVPIAVYPRALSDEEGTAFELYRSIQH